MEEEEKKKKKCRSKKGTLHLTDQDVTLQGGDASSRILFIFLSYLFSSVSLLHACPSF